MADRIGGEILSADSRQVYKNMNIGTGKDYDQYLVNGQKIPYHLIDLVDPGIEYNLYRYMTDFLQSFKSIIKREKVPVICGGSGLYLHAILKGYDLAEVPVNRKLRNELVSSNMEQLKHTLLQMKVPHNKTDLEDRDRLLRAIEIARYDQEHSIHRKNLIGFEEVIPIRKVVFGIQFDRETIRKRITARLKARIREGMIDEVNTLLDSGITIRRLESFGLEYRYATLFLTGKLSYQEMFDRLNIAIHQFAKRQLTWFRKMEREGIEIKWINGLLPLESKVKIVCEAVGG